MAPSSLQLHALRAFRRSSSICPRCAVRQGNNTTKAVRTAIQQRYSSSESAPPPLLSKIKSDLKTAMRAKDTARLNVLRAIISETNQAASGPSPIKSDMQVLALLKKRKVASQAAAREAEQVRREDLQLKQEKEITVIDEYVGTVKMVEPEEVRELVGQALQTLRSSSSSELKAGAVMKEVLKAGGPLDGRPVDRASVAEAVKEALAGTLEK